MSIALVTHQGATGTNPTTAGVDTTGATLLIAVVSNYSASASGVTVSDSKGNTWHRRTAYDSGTTNGHVAIFYAYDKSGSTLVVGAGHTCTLAGSTLAVVAFMAFSGTLTGSDPYDSTENGAGSTSSPAATFQPGSITPSQAGELVISGISGNITSFAINSSFTITDSGPYGSTTGGAGAYLVQTSAVAVNPAWTMQSSGLSVAASIAAFRAAASGGTFQAAWARQANQIVGSGIC